MLEAEFREKFTERFKLQPDEVIPQYVLDHAEMLPVGNTELTQAEALWAKKIAQKLKRVDKVFFDFSSSGRICSRHPSTEDCDNCYRGTVLPKCQK